MNSNLEMQVNKTQAGLYTVTYGYKEASLDVEEAAFAAQGLAIVSPAQLGFLRATQQKGDTKFNCYSRTSADVFYDDRDNGQVVIVPDGAISRLVGVANLVDAHRKDKEYVIPKEQRELVYGLVDRLLKQDTAFVAQHGERRIQTSDFERNDLTARLFSDKSLGIEAHEYGNWLQSKGIDVSYFFMDEKDYSQAQQAPYLNRLSVFGSGGSFGVVGGGNLDLDNSAFGVRFERTAINKYTDN